MNIRNSELVATFKKLSNLLDQVLKLCLKGQSCKLYNDKYMIAPTQITNTEIFAFIAVLVLKLKLKQTEKTIETVKQWANFLKNSNFYG